MKKRMLYAGFVATKELFEGDEQKRVVEVVRELIASLEKHGFKLTQMVRVDIEKED